MNYKNYLINELKKWEKIKTHEDVLKHENKGLCAFLIDNGFYEKNYLEKKGELFENGKKPLCYMCILNYNNLCGVKHSQLGKLYNKHIDRKEEAQIINKFILCLKTELDRVQGIEANALLNVIKNLKCCGNCKYGKVKIADLPCGKGNFPVFIDQVCSDHEFDGRKFEERHI